MTGETRGHDEVTTSNTCDGNPASRIGVGWEWWIEGVKHVTKCIKCDNLERKD